MELVAAEAIQGLKKLGEKTGKNLCEQLVDLYLTTSPEVFQKMESHLADKSYKDLAREAHSFKSSSANLGAIKISSVAALIENSILGDGEFNEAQVTTWIEELQELFPRTVEEIQKLTG